MIIYEEGMLLFFSEEVMVSVDEAIPIFESDQEEIFKYLAMEKLAGLFVDEMAGAFGAYIEKIYENEDKAALFEEMLLERADEYLKRNIKEISAGLLLDILKREKEVK